MAKELKRIDVSNVPELLRIAEEVHSSGEARVLGRDSEDLAILRPVKRPAKHLPRGRPVRANDALWNLVGIGRSEGPGDVSTNKHKYLAEAYLRDHKTL